MNTPLTRPLVTTVLAALLALSTSGIVGSGAGVAYADTPCEPRSTHAAFEQFGDDAQYFLVEDGDFEDGADGWELDRAKVVKRQSEWRVNGEEHRRALRIAAGGSASLRLCVTAAEDVVRFFYATPRRGGEMEVTIEVDSRRHDHWVLSNGSEGWVATPRLAIPQTRSADGQMWMTITIRNTGRRHLFVDDVMVDPWVAR